MSPKQAYMSLGFSADRWEKFGHESYVGFFETPEAFTRFVLMGDDFNFSSLDERSLEMFQAFFDSHLFFEHLMFRGWCGVDHPEILGAYYFREDLV